MTPTAAWTSADRTVELYLGDCLPILQGWADSSIDAVLTDPPYGIRSDEKRHRKAGWNGWKDYGETHWDRARPSREYFEHMLRVSRQQIIWGGNYFADLLPPSMGWLSWDKGQRDFSLADFELAWTNRQKAARCVPYARRRALADGRHHPTQKPIGVMLWCLGVLDESTTVVLDPFMGSGTTGVACVKLGWRFVGIELDKAYFAIAVKRIKEAFADQALFTGVHA